MPAKDLEPIPGARASVKDDVAERIKEAVAAKKAWAKAVEAEESVPEPAPVSEKPTALFSMGSAAVVRAKSASAEGSGSSSAERSCAARGSTNSLADHVSCEKEGASGSPVEHS